MSDGHMDGSGNGNDGSRDRGRDVSRGGSRDVGGDESLNVVLVGVGGQGTLLAAKILGEAGLKAGVNVVASEIHGMAQRGGVVTSMVRFGNVWSPLVSDGDADVILGTEPVEAYRAIRKISKKTTVIASVNPIHPFTVSIGKEEYPDIEEMFAHLEEISNGLIKVDAESLAEKAGSKIAANIVLLGALAGTGLLPFDDKFLIEAVKENVPQRAVDLNMTAYELGKNTVK